MQRVRRCCWYFSIGTSGTYFPPSEAGPRHPLVTPMGGTGPGLSVWVEQREQKIHIWAVPCIAFCRPPHCIHNTNRVKTGENGTFDTGHRAPLARPEHHFLAHERRDQYMGVGWRMVKHDSTRFPTLHFTGHHFLWFYVLHSAFYCYLSISHSSVSGLNANKVGLSLFGAG